MVTPSAGTTIGIGGVTAASPAPPSDTYTTIGSLSTLPSYGENYDDIQFENMGANKYEHNTGAKNSPKFTIGVGRDISNAGQAAVIAANGVNAYHNFKITFSDGKIDYISCKVQGYRTTPGGLTANVMAEIDLQPDAAAFDLNN